MTSARWRLGVGLVLLGLAGVSLYLTEWVEVTRNLGPSDTARRQPYLAADRFLARLGSPVTRYTDLGVLDHLPPGTDLIVLERAGPLLAGTRLEKLLSWVEEGGRLIVRAGPGIDAAGADPLLEALGVRVQEQTLITRLTAGSSQESAGAGECDLPQPTPVSFASETEPVRAGFGTRRYLELPDDGTVVHADNDAGPQLLYLERGLGSVAVLTEFGLWHNGRIGCLDHAHLLRLLVSGSENVRWIARIAMPSLATLMLRSYGLALTLLASGTLLWGWHKGMRLGRPRPEPSRVRRDVTMHVQGAARFLWQQQAIVELLAGLRGRVENLAGSRLDRLAQETGLEPMQIRHALTARSLAGPDDLRGCVETLVRLNRVLQKNETRKPT